MKGLHLLSVILFLVATLSKADAADRATAENLVLITYDGLRWQEVFGGADETILAPDVKAVEDLGATRHTYWADTPEERRRILLPFFWNVIAKEGQIIGDAERGSLVRVTNTRNLSYPGYNELLSGAPDIGIDSNAKKNNPNTNVLEWIDDQPGYGGKVAAFSSWDVFPYILNSERNGLPVDSGWEGRFTSPDPKSNDMLGRLANEVPHIWRTVRFDAFTYYAAEDYIRRHRPRVVYISFGETDDFAHEARYDMYLDSARNTDEFIRRLWETLQSMRQYRGRTALLISTDHGRGDTPSDWTSHGEKVSVSDRIWFAALGAGVSPKGVTENVQATQSQFAATGAALLGLEYKGGSGSAAPPLNLK